MTTNTSGQQVLQPYMSPQLRDERTITVEISSRDRDLSKPLQNPAKFRYRFTHPLKDIRSVRLVGGTIPAVYNINKPYNSLLFRQTSDDGTGGILTLEVPITIPPGFYTETYLCTLILSSINSAPGSLGAYGCGRDSIKGIFVLNIAVQADPLFSFSLDFKNSQYTDLIDPISNSLVAMKGMARILGFGNDVYTSTPDTLGNPTILSPFCMDALAATSRLYLYINAESKYDIGSIDRGSGRKKPFAIIYPDTVGTALNDIYLNGITTADPNAKVPTIKYLNKETYRPVYVSLPQPMSKISALDIELRDEFGNLVNLAGRDFSLLLDMDVLME